MMGMLLSNFNEGAALKLPLASYACWPGGLPLRGTGFAGVIPAASRAGRKRKKRVYCSPMQPGQSP